MLFPERFSSRQWMPPSIRYQHLARYRWSAGWARDARVVDAACGTGYGARMLRDAGALSVDGFDISQEAIDEARSLHQRDGLRFERADVTSLPAPDRSYDAAVSFETIEHVADEDAFLSEISRVLKPGGYFLCSTPNRALRCPAASVTDRPLNPFHVREYTWNEFAARMNLYFDSISGFGQTWYPASYASVLAAVGGYSDQLSTMVHFMWRMAKIPWEREEIHYPQSMAQSTAQSVAATGVPEMLIAVCRRKP